MNPSESFNARFMSPQGVAETFVPSKAFAKLVEAGNSVLIGPRGSGKTTLLKMLHPTALRNWQHPQADAHRSKVTYSTVFVPADISWGKQLQLLGGAELTAAESVTLSTAAYATHVFRACIDTFEARVIDDTRAKEPSFLKLPHDREAEARACTQIAALWRLDVLLPTFKELKSALRLRQLEIADIACDTTRIEGSQHLTLDPLLAFSSAIEVFNEEFNDNQRHWALVVDELEIAPINIQKMLFSALRSTSQKIYLKLAISPFTDSLQGSDPTNPAGRNDFVTIPLWNTGRNEAVQFGRALFENILRREPTLSTLSIESLLGASISAGIPDEDFEPVGQANLPLGIDPYAEHGSTTREYQRLAEIDNSFKKYVRDKGIDVSNLAKSSTGPNYNRIRKITPLVIYRNYFMKAGGASQSNDGELHRKTLKNPAQFYVGDPAIFVVAEGNPRWITHIAMELRRALTLQNAPKDNSYLQSQVVADTSNRFKAMVRTIPVESNHSLLAKDGLLGLVGVLSKWVLSQVQGEFTEDPHLSFDVDKDVPPELHNAIKQALNIGALVYVNVDADDLLNNNLLGRRFRLSYMLAPAYRLPLRGTNEIRLSRVLQGAIRSPNSLPTQPPLFGDQAKLL